MCRLEFTNSTTAGNHVREQAQQLLQQNWAEIGAKMIINNLPPAVMWGDYWMMSKFDSAMVGIDFMVGPDPDSTDFFSSKSIGAKGGGGQNTCQYESPVVDQCLAEGASTVDQAKRKAAYLKMQEETRKDLPYLPHLPIRHGPGREDQAAGLRARRECPGELLQRQHLVLGLETIRRACRGGPLGTRPTAAHGDLLSPPPS